MGWGSFLKLFFAIALSHATSLDRFDLNDVSILFALPLPQEMNTLLLKPDDLLPAEVYTRNTHLTPEDYHPIDTYKNLRAVGMRIDPCFKMSAEQTSCTKQIRIVWQPLFIDPKSKLVTTDDAAIHTFYNLNEHQWSVLLNELKTLKKKSNIQTHKKPLSIHPALANSNTRVQFQSDLNAIILKFAGKHNLVRFTFMRLQTRDLWWVFGGFDHKDNEWTKIKIPRVESLVDDPVQNFFNEESVPTEMGMRGAIVFSTKDRAESFDDIVSGYHQPKESDRKEFESKLSLVARIEDPRKFNPNNMDCVHCHLTEPVRNYINHGITNLKQPRSFMQEMKLERSYNMKNISAHKNNTRALRSFGYFRSSPHVNQRVINESADVAEQLNSVQF
ncbi:MAG: hypothetical protein KA715_06750 [Xanthomonadaceae bacterium]|nr:hypothetical protein [Xanthomonadaceae bacterium]